MPRKLTNIVPQKDCPRWLYEILRRIDVGQDQTQSALGAIERNESPDGSGSPLLDLTKYLYKPGLPGGQVAYGDTTSAGTLTLNSTAHATKGLIYFGDAHASAYDEANNRLGLGTAAPVPRLHVLGFAGSQFQASSDITPFGTEWGTNGAATQWQAILTADDSTSFAHRHGDVGTRNFDLGLNGTIDPAVTSWTVSYRARYEGTAPTAGTTFAIGIATSAALRYMSANIDATLLTTSWTDYTTTITVSGGASATANSMRLTCTPAIFFDGYVEITYVAFAPTSGGTTAGKTAIFQTVSNQTDTLTEWQNVANVSLIDISAAGLLTIQSGGSFKHVPGAGASKLLTSDSTGLATWTTPNLLSASHGDAAVGTVARGDLITGQSATPKWTRLAKGTANQLLTMDGSATDVAWASLGSLPADFADNLFTVHDDGDATKKLAFQCSGVTTATTRTLTVPNASGTLPLLSLAQTWTAKQTFDSASNTVCPAQIDINSQDAGTGGAYDANAGLLLHEPVFGYNVQLVARTGMSNNITVTLPAVSTLLVGSSETVTLTNKTLSSGTKIKCTAGTTPFFQDTGSPTKQVSLDLTGLTASTNSVLAFSASAARTWTLGNVPGLVTVTGNGANPPASGAVGKVDATAQSADIASTNLTNSTPAGWYRVAGYLADTAADVTAGAVTLTISWTDDVGATTSACTQVLTGTGRKYLNDPVGSQDIYLASGNITYATTHTGLFGTAQYAVRLRCTFLG